MKQLKHKKFMQIYEATRWPITNSIKYLWRWMKPLNIEENELKYEIAIKRKGSSK